MEEVNVVVRLNSGQAEFNGELADAIKVGNVGLVSYAPPERGVTALTDIIVALSSAGAFTTLYQIICKILDRSKDREISITHKGKTVVLKGHTASEEIDLIKKLMIEFPKDKPEHR